MTRKSQSQFYKFTDKGEFISGIPNRDLTMDEFNALPDELQKQALDSGLYQISSDVEIMDIEEGE